MRQFLLMRGYEVLSCEDPTSVCAVSGNDRDFCGGGEACCDVLITDTNMPGANGIDLLEQQARKRCKLDTRNKLVISGSLDARGRERLRSRCGRSPGSPPCSSEKRGRSISC